MAERAERREYDYYDVEELGEEEEAPWRRVTSEDTDELEDDASPEDDSNREDDFFSATSLLGPNDKDQ